MLESLPEASENSPRRAGKPASTVLVVDDEPLVRWAVAETLGDRGYRVTQAPDAASAIQAIAAEQSGPDVVLLDLRLPDSNDLRALSVIHRRFPALPVVLMTAHGSPELFDEAIRRGAAAVVSKPFEMADLAPLIERVMGPGPA